MGDKALEEILSNVGDEDEKKFKLEEKHLTFLFRSLHGLSNKWYSLCMQLEVKECDQIDRNATSIDHCLALGLQSWLRGDNVSWKQLIEAIYRPAGGDNHRLARLVAKSFKSMCTFTPIKQARTTSTASILGDSYDNVEKAVRNLQNMLDGKVAARWYQMGITLGAAASKMEEIQVCKPTAQEGERMMLDVWLRNRDNDKTTWQWFVDAVGHVAGGNHQRLSSTLAKEIASGVVDSSTRAHAPLSSFQGQHTATQLHRMTTELASCEPVCCEDTSKSSEIVPCGDACIRQRGERAPSDINEPKPEPENKLPPKSKRSADDKKVLPSSTWCWGLVVLLAATAVIAVLAYVKLPDHSHHSITHNRMDHTPNHNLSHVPRHTPQPKAIPPHHDPQSQG